MLRTGGDDTGKLRDIIRVTFQSTHPTRGATLHSGVFAFFNAVSIHAPHTGCDYWSSCLSSRVVFQSTHPTRGATCFFRIFGACSKCFNPRTPHGVRLVYGALLYLDGCFNPRTPHGVRPHRPTRRYRALQVSIHAPHTGCDSVTSNI